MLRNAGIQRIMSLLVGGLALVSFVLIATTSYLLSQKSADGVLINLAGRQRMLSQKLSKELASLHLADSASERARIARELGDTVDLFSSTLSALADGGRIVGADGERVIVPAAENERVVEAIAAGSSLWRELEPALRAEVSGQAHPDESRSKLARQRVLADSTKLLVRMNELTQAYQDESDAKTAILGYVQIFAALLSILATIACLVFVQRGVVQPILSLESFCSSLKQGDLTAVCSVSGAGEVRAMSGTLLAFRTSLVENLKSIEDFIRSLLASADQLATTSTELGRATDRAASEATTAASGTAEAHAASQSVATAATQLSATINEIARASSEAVMTVDKAVLETEQASASIGELYERSNEIGDILLSITSIAEQTNLLALNATIEAARAGEAGKGFSVVANEVKELAQQTASSTSDIEEKVGAIQRSTENAKQSASRIVEIIQNIHNVQTTIATTVEEQSSATNEISRSITASAERTDRIKGSIEGVAEAAELARGTSAEYQALAVELSRSAKTLKELIARYRYV